MFLAEAWAAALVSLESASKEHCTKLAEELFTAAVDAKIDAGEFDDSASSSTESAAGDGGAAHTSMGAGAAKLATSGAQAETAYRVESAGPAADSVLCAALSKHGLPAAARLARRVGAEQSMALAAADAKHGANGHIVHVACICFCLCAARLRDTEGASIFDTLLTQSVRSGYDEA